jgi:tRNA pseudouridine55 synthase
MARKRGRDISGWLIVDKPAGLGSTDVVGKVRWALDARKAGHAGTLDPSATGLLAVALGEATKTVPHASEGDKHYDFTIRLGVATDSDDADGAVIATRDIRPSDDALRAALAAFRGDILQVPPRVSAVKVEGARAYDLARDGEDFALAARPLRVSRLDLVDRPDPDHARLEMVCGRGGYVRSVARDLGAALGCLAHVTTLRRLSSGPFDLASAVTLAQVEAEARTPALEARLLPLEAALAGLPEARLSAEGAVRLRNGNPGAVTWTTAGHGDVAWGSWQGRAVAVGRYLAGELHPDRVFLPT